MIVTDGRIRWVGPAARLKIPAGAETVDCSGKFIVPGIINLHGHLGNVVGLVQDPKNFTRQNVEAQLATYARYGVTSVLSMGSDQPLIFDLRAEQRAGRPKLTRIFTAGRGFTGPGGYPTTAPGMKGVPYEVATVEDVKKALAELAPKKPDILKIWVDDHLGKEVKIPLEISTAIIQEGRKLGLRTAAHIFYYEDAKALAERGLYATAHSVRDKPVDQALINAMKKSGTWQLGTLVRELSVFVFSEPPDFLKDPFFTMSVAPEVIQTIDSPAYRKRLQSDPDVPKYRGFLKTAQQNLKTLYDAGVKVGFATDSGPPARFSGFFEHKEMELMTEAGFRPLEIITIFSKNSAEFLRMSKDLGTVEPGHWADFIILTKNPADDIKNMRAIDAVYIAGNRVR
ncbi:MAG: amidohydrolase family protein [Bryobacteraceae bacterium]|nr:amidohydrolase family protein [Bryobacteraceae bacterium]MDW8379725.1 amidohydrolase family protein [Bryobacterales bacterium]